MRKRQLCPLSTFFIPTVKLGNKGWSVLQLDSSIKFVRSLEQITIKYFKTIHPDKHKNDSIFDK